MTRDAWQLHRPHHRSKSGFLGFRRRWKTHNQVILDRCQDDLEREFYLRMTRRMGWTRRVLVHQIENQTYEKTLVSQTNFADTLPEPIRDQARLAVKDAYTFDFLELGDEHSERQLEAPILAQVELFLREMGGRFSFVGSQYRLEVAGKEYFIDRVVRTLPEELKGQLPEPEQVARLLEGLG